MAIQLNWETAQAATWAAIGTDLAADRFSGYIPFEKKDEIVERLRALVGTANVHVRGGFDAALLTVIGPCNFAKLLFIAAAFDEKEAKEKVAAMKCTHVLTPAPQVAQKISTEMRRGYTRSIAEARVRYTLLAFAHYQVNDFSLVGMAVAAILRRAKFVVANRALHVPEAWGLIYEEE